MALLSFFSFFFFWVSVCVSTNFKSIVMLKSKIKTHAIGKTYAQPHFFILNKGNHSGKPLRNYCANCFVFLADDEEEREFYFFLFSGIYELGIFRRCLIGSVIQFIRIGDLCDIAEEIVNNVNSGNRSYFEINSTLQQIEAHKIKLVQQVDYLVQLRKSLFHSYLRK